MPRGIGAQRRFRDRDEIGPLGAFLRLERGGTDLVIVPIERPGSSPPARRRRARALTDGTEERLRSEGT